MTLTPNPRPLIIGITGSLASGKSHILSIFAAEGAVTQNSDIVVHELIDSEAKKEISKHFQGVLKNKKINRKKLGAIVFSDEKQLRKLESILHPLVRQKNLEFIKNNRHKKIIALEIPLLFETKAEAICDYVIYVDSPLKIRQKRAFEREGMDAETFKKVAKHQMPEPEKRKKSDFIIDNATSAEAKKQVQKILEKINA